MDTSIIFRNGLNLLILITFIIGESSAQTAGNDALISLKNHQLSSIDLINEIQEQSTLQFNYNPNDLKQSLILKRSKRYKIDYLIQQLTDLNQLAYSQDGRQYILYKLRKKKKPKLHTVKGYIEDFYSKERLIGAHIIIPGSGKGTISNESGFFSLTLPKGNIRVNSSYIGYAETETPIAHTKDTSLIIQLRADAYLDDIEIIAEKKNATELSEMSSVSLTQNQLNSNPSFLGEADIIKSIQSLPGVSSSNGINPGLIVRGGGQDQNLILLDGVTLYNISHLLGLFSIFNTDIIKNTTLTKGAFPARYAGRLSSILDIRLNDGDLEQIHGTGAISMIASKFTLQGPIKNNKTSFVISGRRSYADLIIKPFIPKLDDPQVEGVDPQFSFYDTYFKLQHIVNSKHRLFLNLYKGEDNYGFYEQKISRTVDNKINWGNDIATVRWNWEINNKLFAHTSLNYLDFNQSFEFVENNFTVSENRYSTNYESSLEDISLQIKLDYVPSPDHFIRFGLTSQAHKYNPGSSRVTEETINESLDTIVIRKNIDSKEFNLFIEDDFNYGNLNINAGINMSAFHVENTLYSSLQPRISANYQLRESISLKASYSKMTQYNYLVTSENNLFFSDLWVTSTKRIKPQNSWMVSSGIVYTPKDNIELSLEGYYKYMKNVINYKSGIENTFGSSLTDWESELVQGIGTSYGMELFAKKARGKISGWISYALSWNWRQYDSINKGDKYPFKYDSRHQFSVVGNYQFNSRINLSVQWNYSSGNFTTLSTIQIPTNIGPSENNNPVINGVDVITNRNNYQFSNSHRLDFSLSFKRQLKRHTRIWSIGLINAYASANPTYIRSTFVPDPQNPALFKRQFEEVSLLPVLPSISYRFEF